MKLKIVQVAFRTQKPLNLHNKHCSRFMIGATAFLSCFILSFIASSLIIQPQPTKAVTGLSLVSVPTMSLSSSNPSLNLQITPTTSGTLASSFHTLIASTNVPTGYNLSLTTPTTPTLTPSSGTISTPAILANNTWGYAVPGAGGFDPSYTTPTPAATSKWANPSTTATIKHTTASTTNDNTTVYYGTKIDFSQPSGVYNNTIQYTATANIPNIPTPLITKITLANNVTPAIGTTAGNTPIEITGTGFTVNDQSVTTAVTLDNINCTNISISSNTPAIGQDTIYCNTPTHPTTGTVNVAVTTWRSTATASNSYTYAAPNPIITTPTANQIFSAGTANTTLNVTTNYPATCYYGTATNPAVQMATTGGTAHSQSITGLANASTNTRYVRCQAAAGHTHSSNTSVTFYIRAATPAAPTSFKPTHNITIGTGINQVNNIAATVASGVTCTYTTNKGTLTADDITNLTAGATTITYSCTAGSGNTISAARTGSWSFTIDTAVTTAVTMQTVARTTRCLATTYIRAQDARDTATYWIKRIDGYPSNSENTTTIYDAALPPNYSQCWMLTNLAYGGGGTNTYGDTKAIVQGSTSADYIYTAPRYFIPTGSNRTTGATNPSTSTNGIGQYGYLYNWCAAMGAQTGTAACADTTTPAPNANISICPSSWRLPTGGSNSEYLSLNTVTNAGLTNSDLGLRSNWLAMYSGYFGWYANGSAIGIGSQNGYGHYWSVTQNNSYVYAMYFEIQYTDPQTYNYYKPAGFAIRCVVAS